MLKQIVKQLIFTLLFLSTPIVWFRFVNYINVSNSYKIFSIGILFMLESYWYVKLPMDLIPDCIPILGKCDNLMAYFIGILGFWITICTLLYII